MATKNAGAGRGFVNPQRTDEPDETYVTPSQRYEMEKERQEQKEQAQNEAAYNEASQSMGKKRGGKIKHHVKHHAKGGSAHHRADGIAERGHTKGRYL